MTNCYGALCTISLWTIICFPIIILMILTGFFIVIRGDVRNTNRPRGLLLGREIKLNVWNSRVVYAPSGLHAYKTENGQEVVLYENEEQKRIAEHFFTGGRYFPDATILPMDSETKFGFEHPSYGCLSHNKSDARYKK
jgi:hypothetical protein